MNKIKENKSFNFSLNHGIIAIVHDNLSDLKSSNTVGNKNVWGRISN